MLPYYMPKSKHNRLVLEKTIKKCPVMHKKSVAAFELQQSQVKDIFAQSVIFLCETYVTYM